MKISKSFVILISCIIVFISLTIIMSVLFYIYGEDYQEILYVTFMTISYHFVMRVLVGELVTKINKNKEFNYDLKWFRVGSIERRLYKLIKINKWKTRVLTACPEQFNLKNVSLDELLHNITNAEIIHEIISVLSFMPIILIIWYGRPLVFILTSVFACLADLLFVMIQRYNRPKVLKLKKYMERH